MTCVDVAVRWRSQRTIQVEKLAHAPNVPSPERVRAKPVMAVESIGLTPMSPAMADGGTELMPLWARMRKLPAVPRLT